MKMKKIAASAAVLLLAILSFGINNRSVPMVNTSMTAAADYEFEFVDEDDAEDAQEAYSDEDYDYEDSSEGEWKTVERSYSPVRSFFISLVIGVVIALIAVSIMKSSMKSVRKKTGATEYRKQNSFNLSVKTDDHLGTKVEKSPIARAASAGPQNPNIRK